MSASPASMPHGLAVPISAMMPLDSATACLFAIGVWRRFVGVIVALARRPDECIARVHAAWARGADLGDDAVGLCDCMFVRNRGMATFRRRDRGARAPTG